MTVRKGGVLLTALCAGLLAAAGAHAGAAPTQGTPLENAKPATAVFAHDAGGRGVTLKCSGDSLSVAFMVAPGNFRRPGRSRAGLFKKRALTLTFADGSRAETASLFIPSLKTAMTGDRALFAKVFAGARKGETVRVEVEGLGPVEIGLPPRNRALDAFAAHCPHIKGAE